MDEKFQDLFDRYERCQGGFVWEWIDHGLRTHDNAGRKFFGYGGDFGEEIHDGTFVADGLLFPDRTPSPGLVEFAHVIRPVRIGGSVATGLTSRQLRWPERLRSPGWRRPAPRMPRPPYPGGGHRPVDQRSIDAVAGLIESGLVALRRNIHQHPEVAGEERRTAALVADRLRAAGLTVATGVGGHGVIGMLRGARQGCTVAYRADMDAVPAGEAIGGSTEGGTAQRGAPGRRAQLGRATRPRRRRWEPTEGRRVGTPAHAANRALHIRVIPPRMARMQVCRQRAAAHQGKELPSASRESAGQAHRSSTACGGKMDNSPSSADARPPTYLISSSTSSVVMARHAAKPCEFAVKLVALVSACWQLLDQNSRCVTRVWTRIRSTIDMPPNNAGRARISTGRHRSRPPPCSALPDAFGTLRRSDPAVRPWHVAHRRTSTDRMITMPVGSQRW